MITPIQKEILRKLGAVCELSPSVRIGQLASHLGFLAEDMFDTGLAEIPDEQLLQILERHELELSRRQAHVA
jgi:hypothetical protein